MLTANMVLAHFMRATFDHMAERGAFKSVPVAMVADPGYLAALAKQKAERDAGK